MEEADHPVVDQRGRALSTTTTTEHRRPIRRPPSATSKTPRRRNTNPQSSSPPRRRRDDDDDTTNNIKDDGITNHITINNDIINNDKEQPPTSSPPSPLATPLTTLTTLLRTSHTHQATLLTLFRTSHSLHLHAIDRKTKAIEALRLAQAELEHATTAEEFAKVELQRSKLSKDNACGRHDVLKGEVSKLASGYKGTRVQLVNLTSNSNWNGRCGTIVNMITDGEDLGRWKVRLDSDWRGKEPDGNYSVGDGGGGGGVLSQDWEHVVAKAENLKLIDGGGDVPSFLGDGRSQQQQVDGNDVAKSRSTSRSTSRSPSSLDRDEVGKGKHHPLDPVEELPEESYNHHIIVTPERRGGRRRIYNNNNNSHQPSSPPQQHEDEYDWKRNALGSQHSPPGYYEPDDHHQFVHHRHATAAPVMHHHHSQVQKRQEEPPQQTKQQLQRIHGHHQHEPKQKQQQQQQQMHYVSPRASKRSPKSSPNMQQQQQMYNRNQVSSFSEMVSPESFAPVSFQIETSESFSQRDAVLPPSSSFFEEVTPREDTQHVPNHQYHSYQEESNEERSKTSAHSSLQAPATHSNSLPTVVVLPVNDEDEGRNRNGPPTCVGVQNAGISHVNGLYVLAPNNHQDDEEESSSPQPNSSNNNADVPPLYFRDAEPILLSDKRYYDMCILRIDCPDSPEYVIWFLSRVDIDPDCLDVKFSDCYYYCRVLRSVGLYVPPMDGWSVPDVQQEQLPGDDDAAAFTTVDDEASFVNDQERLHSSMSSGLGIVPRSAENDYV